MPSRTYYMAVAFFLITAIVVTAALYWPGLAGPFLLDDMQNIVKVYVPDFNRDEIIYAATHNTSGILGRPVSVLSLIFSGIVHGPGSWGYKYHNLLIHLINGLLVFWLFLRLLPRMAEGLSEKRLVFTAGLAAALWLLHPLMVSTVLYAVQRMAQLSSLFTLVALLFHAFARENIGKPFFKFHSLAYLGFPVATALAFLSKENGALVPFYVLAIELAVFGFKTSSGLERRRLYLFYGITAILPILLGSLYLLTRFEHLADYSMRDFTLVERLMTQLHVVVFYLKLILLPRLADMSLFHDYQEVTRQLDLLTVVLLVLLALAAGLVFYLRKKAPVISFAIAWFLISHLMESTFINLELVFEHRNYLAAAGPLLAGIFYLLNSPKYQALKYVSVTLALLFAFMTYNRIQEWKSFPMLLQIAVLDHPRSYRANTEFANLSFNSGDSALAIKHLRIAQEVNQKDYGAIIHEIVYRCGSGESLAPLFERAMRRAEQYPVSAYTLNGFDNLIGLYSKGRCPEVQLDQLLALIQTSKGQDKIASNLELLGFLERLEGSVYLLQGKYFEAVHHITQAYEKTGLVIILVELVSMQLSLSRLDDARHLIEYLDQINAESFGIESAKIKPLKEKLAKLESERSGAGG